MIYISHFLAILLGYFIGKKYGSILPFETQAEKTWTAIKIAVSAVGMFLVNFGLGEEAELINDLLSSGDTILGLGLDIWGVILQVIVIAKELWTRVSGIFSSVFGVLIICLMCSSINAQGFKNSTMLDEFKYERSKSVQAVTIQSNVQAEYQLQNFAGFLGKAAQEVLKYVISGPKTEWQKQEIEFLRQENKVLKEENAKYKEFVFEIARLNTSI